MLFGLLFVAVPTCLVHLSLASIILLDLNRVSLTSFQVSSAHFNPNLDKVIDNTNQTSVEVLPVLGDRVYCFYFLGVERFGIYYRLLQPNRPERKIVVFPRVCRDEFGN